MARGIKTGGRRKGTTNKLTGTVKEMISQFVSEELQNLPTLLKNLELKEKIDLLLKLLPYTTPKIAPVGAPANKLKSTISICKTSIYLSLKINNMQPGIS